MGQHIAPYYVVWYCIVSTKPQDQKRGNDGFSNDGLKYTHLDRYRIVLINICINKYYLSFISDLNIFINHQKLRSFFLVLHSVW